MYIFPAYYDASYDATIVYFMMRRMTVKIRRHASFLDSGLLRSNKDDRLITKHSPGGIFSSCTHRKYLDWKFSGSDIHSIMMNAKQVDLTLSAKT